MLASKRSLYYKNPFKPGYCGPVTNQLKLKLTFTQSSFGETTLIFPSSSAMQLCCPFQHLVG